MNSPQIVLSAIVLTMFGSMLTKNLILLLGGWVLFILPLTKILKVSKQHFKYLVSFILPLAITLFVVWYFLIGAPPDQAVGSNPLGGANYALTTSVRLALLGGLAQVIILPIPLDALSYRLHQVGLRGDLLIIIVSAFALIPEFSQRANKIITARYARGLVKNRKLLTRLKQIPYIIRPLLTGALRTALSRMELWDRWGHIDNFANLSQPVTLTSNMIPMSYLFGSFLWLGLAIFFK
jgi:energy-coupling factor transporter transmembrane protein EcfT